MTIENDTRRVMERLASDLRDCVAVADALPDRLIAARLSEALDTIEERLASKG